MWHWACRPALDCVGESGDLRLQPVSRQTAPMASSSKIPRRPELASWVKWAHTAAEEGAGPLWTPFPKGQTSLLDPA